MHGPSVKGARLEKEQVPSPSACQDAAIRRFVEDAWPLDAAREPQVRRWRVASRTTLLLLLTFSVLQFYFFDVYLTIMAMPRVTLPGAITEAALKVKV